MWNGGSAIRRATAGTSSAMANPPAAAARNSRRRASHQMTAPMATATRWGICSSPSRADAAQPATAWIQPIPTLVGQWMTSASGPPTTPAATPADRLHIMIGPATGAASRLAGKEATGTPPKVAISSGDTANWAETVTAIASANMRGPGKRSARRGAHKMMPADAATDSRNATEWTNSGSTSTNRATARASTRRLDASRPSRVAVAAIAAMTEARSTDGSNRVTRAKKPMAPRVSTQRPR